MGCVCWCHSIDDGSGAHARTLLSDSSDTETGGIWDPLGLSQNEGSLAKYRAVRYYVLIDFLPPGQYRHEGF